MSRAAVPTSWPHEAGIFSPAPSAETDAAAECPTIQRQTVWYGEALSGPGPPRNLTALVGGGTVVLTWSAPSSGGAPSSYVIQAGSSSGSSDLASFDTGNIDQSFTATDVPAGTYFVRVRARNATSTSDASNEVVIVVGGGTCTNPPGPPGRLGGGADRSLVMLSWSPPTGGCPPTTYVIAVGSLPGLSDLANFSTGNTATRFSRDNIPDGIYYVRILAANNFGISTPSNEVRVIPSQRQHLQPFSCTLEGGVRSIDTRTATSVQFINISTQLRRLYWLDYSGRRVFYFLLQPGGSFIQATYVTHPWLVADSGDRCLLIYFPASAPGVAFP